VRADSPGSSDAPFVPSRPASGECEPEGDSPPSETGTGICLTFGVAEEGIGEPSLAIEALLETEPWGELESRSGLRELPATGTGCERDGLRELDMLGVSMLLGVAMCCCAGELEVRRM
jgi:hypothetical protein